MLDTQPTASPKTRARKAAAAIATIATIASLVGVPTPASAASLPMFILWSKNSTPDKSWLLFYHGGSAYLGPGQSARTGGGSAGTRVTMRVSANGKQTTINVWMRWNCTIQAGYWTDHVAAWSNCATS